MSIDILIEKIKKCGNPTVVGLDPLLDYIPDSLRTQFKNVGDAIFAFNKAIIDAVCGVVPAVKPQSAYYELYGLSGLRALSQTCAYAKEKGMYVILDVKRGDIGSTAAAYAGAYLDDSNPYRDFAADGCTVNPYLGTDGVLPFAEACGKRGKSIFVLVKTSNPSSGELQDLDAGGKPLYEKVAELVNQWGAGLSGKNGYSAVGAVVGATYPEQLAALRKKTPKAYFLVPGYGAQGGGAKDVAGAFNKDGLGAIVNSSRVILCAWKKDKEFGAENFALAARKEALAMRDALRGVL